MYKIVLQICVEIIIAVFAAVLTEFFLDRFRRPKAQMRFSKA